MPPSTSCLAALGLEFKTRLLVDFYTILSFPNSNVFLLKFIARFIILRLPSSRHRSPSIPNNFRDSSERDRFSGIRLGYEGMPARLEGAKLISDRTASHFLFLLRMTTKTRKTFTKKNFLSHSRKEEKNIIFRCL